MMYSLVLGVDAHTFEFLKLTAPSWKQHKPSLLKAPLVVFVDSPAAGSLYLEVSRFIRQLWGPNEDISILSWPPKGSDYSHWDGSSKWTNPQRAKMLAGSCIIPPEHVQTPYWMKLDLDVVAQDVNSWIPMPWFDGNPSVIAPPWGYTKPANQMMLMDQWAEQHAVFRGTEPLNLKPEPGADVLRHQRFASWCSFYSTEFSKYCYEQIQGKCKPGNIPIASQDGFHWYCATRCGFSINRVQMKDRGWKLCSSLSSVKSALGIK